MSTEHKNITDPNIHEPKGVSTASSGEVYVADGLGSGDWKKDTKIYVQVSAHASSVSNPSGGYEVVSTPTISPVSGTISKVVGYQTKNGPNFSGNTIYLKAGSTQIASYNITNTGAGSHSFNSLSVSVTAGDLLNITSQTTGQQVGYVPLDTQLNFVFEITV